MSHSHSLPQSILLALPCIALFLVPAPIAAQTACDTAVDVRAVHLGIGGGFAQGAPLNRGADIGYSATASVEVGTHVRFLRVRAEGLYANWGPDLARVSALTASIIASAPVRWPAAPYVLAGAGGVTVPNEALARGWMLGTGLRFPGRGYTFFVESRMLAFAIGEAGLRRAGVPVGSAQYNRWQYTATPLVFGVQF